MIFRRTGSDGKKATQGCPCGYLGDTRCRCTPEQIQKYRARISGPLLDRIDVHVEVPAVPHEKLHEAPEGRSTSELRKQVAVAQSCQLQRQDCLNKDLNIQSMENHCALSSPARSLLNGAMEKLGLSARAYHRVIRLARTIADLADSGSIETEHVAEAVQLRCLDRRA